MHACTAAESHANSDIVVKHNTVSYCMLTPSVGILVISLEVILLWQVHNWTIAALHQIKLRHFAKKITSNSAAYHHNSHDNTSCNNFCIYAFQYGIHLAFFFLNFVDVGQPHGFIWLWFSYLWVHGMEIVCLLLQYVSMMIQAQFDLVKTTWTRPCGASNNSLYW